MPCGSHYHVKAASSGCNLKLLAGGGCLAGQYASGMVQHDGNTGQRCTAQAHQADMGVDTPDGVPSIQALPLPPKRD